MRDLQAFHASFYKYKDKETQDAFLLKCCHAEPTKRKRPKNQKHTEKKFQTKFIIYSKSTKIRARVCQKAFLQILGITKHRIQYVMRKYIETGEPVKEKRGGDHKSHLFIRKKEAVMSFINLFHVEEAHYCRGKSQRHYLAAELSINKMFKQYNDQQIEESLKVKRGFFRRVFNTNYSLGFGSPRTDVCSTCLQLLEKIKLETDPTKRQLLMTEKRVHSLRAKAFFSLVKEESPDLKTLSFDCEKNLALPKIPDQSTYYSRQIYLYNCTVVEGSSKSQLTQNNVFAYCWMENQFNKGANEISSIVYHRLMNTDLAGVQTVRLIADGCGGQNKNSIMLAMCSKWLVESAPSNVKILELVFPIVGHSFIPPDRVFAQIEKEVRKRDTIVRPEEYLDIISQWSTVVRMGSMECQVYDFKSSMSSIMKDVGTWHFQFKKCKRFYIARSKNDGNVIIKGDVNYRISDGVYKKVTRKNKLAKDIKPNIITKCQIKTNINKINDVKKLLRTHYGDEWQQVEMLKFYKTVFAQNLEGEETLSDDIVCEPQEEDHNLRI